MRRISLPLIVFLALALLTAGCSKQAAPGNVEPSASAPASSPAETSEATATPVESPETVSEVAPDSSWILVRDITATNNTNVVGFINEDHGITVGGENEIFYTYDGGLTWTQAEGVSNWRYGMCFVNEDLVWAGGWHNAISISRDGGKTWSDPGEFRTAIKLSQLSFIDDKTGWVATYADFGATNDGGVTWTVMNMPEGVKRIGAIDLLTADIGYLLTLDGWLYTTKDSGATWSGIDLDLKRFGIVDMKNRTGWLNESMVAVAELCFLDENNGMVIFIGPVTGKGYQVWMLETNDGGATWREELIALVPDYNATVLYLTEDGKYLTLCDNWKRTLVLKRK